MSNSPAAGSISIDTGVKRILINNDPEKYIEFNPDDVMFMNRFYSFYAELSAKQEEYKKRDEALNVNAEKDANGVPKNMGDKMALTVEAGEFIRGKFDTVFGEGTSQKLFGNAFSIYVVEQFVNGIFPYIKNARVGRVAKYAPPLTKSKIKMRRAMK